ncbi:hypothetical protein LZ30DRAFT_730491 [Colletotrichum cereale]|nr:hypothetical protein LZ30DRAFT_730491 [Colletotrichum cereale]
MCSCVWADSTPPSPTPRRFRKTLNSATIWRPSASLGVMTHKKATGGAEAAPIPREPIWEDLWALVFVVARQYDDDACRPTTAQACPAPPVSILRTLPTTATTLRCLHGFPWFAWLDPAMSLAETFRQATPPRHPITQHPRKVTDDSVPRNHIWRRLPSAKRGWYIARVQALDYTRPFSIHTHTHTLA